MNGVRFRYRARDLRKAADMAAAEYRHKQGVMDSRVKVKNWTLRIESSDEYHGDTIWGIYLDVILHVKLESTGVEYIATHTFNLYHEGKLRAII